MTSTQLTLYAAHHHNSNNKNINNSNKNNNNNNNNNLNTKLSHHESLAERVNLLRFESPMPQIEFFVLHVTQEESRWDDVERIAHVHVVTLEGKGRVRRIYAGNTKPLRAMRKVSSGTILYTKAAYYKKRRGL